MEVTMNGHSPCMQAYLDARLELAAKAQDISLKEYMEARMEAIGTAVVVAREEMTRRLESMNDLRAQLDNQARQFVTKAEHELVVNQLSELREFRASQEGKASVMLVIVTMGLAAAGLFVSIFALLKG